MEDDVDRDGEHVVKSNDQDAVRSPVIVDDGNPSGEPSGAGWEDDASLEDIEAERNQVDGSETLIDEDRELNRSISGNEQVSDAITETKQERSNEERKDSESYKQMD